jgi:hypothetical protein
MSFSATAHAVQPPCLAITRTIWPEWTRAWWPPLSCFWLTLTRLSLPIWLSQEPSDMSGINPDSPLALEFCLRVIYRIDELGMYIYVVHCSIFWFACYLNILFHSLFPDNCHCCILILETYSRYFDPENNPQIGYICNFMSLNITHHKTRLLPIGVGEGKTMQFPCKF